MNRRPRTAAVAIAAPIATLAAYIAWIVVPIVVAEIVRAVAAR